MTQAYETVAKLNEYHRNSLGSLYRLQSGVEHSDSQADFEAMSTFVGLATVLRSAVRNAHMERVYLPLDVLCAHKLSLNDTRRALTD